PGLGNINPFAVDPYDATGSLALILSGLLAPMGVFRAFFPSGALIADEMRSDLRLRWQRPIAVIVVSVVLLAIYPDAQDRGLITALLAIVAGVLFLNFCLHALVLWLFPYTASELERVQLTRFHALNTALHFGLVVITGLFIGAGILLSEMLVSPPAPHVSRLLLVAVFLGVGAFNIAVSYAFLGKLLGIRRAQVRLRPKQPCD
ncbi:MAG: hypothetical protein KGI77_01495, partial [Gammaproteobacteria bacterium]|nr:hypothetical protein [Gammaproteobacteria bacterium]